MTAEQRERERAAVWEKAARGEEAERRKLVQTLAARDAEVTRLTLDVEGLAYRLQEQRVVNAEMTSRIQQLRAALRKLGHAEGCASQIWTVPRPCDCGLDAGLSAQQEAQP